MKPGLLASGLARSTLLATALVASAAIASPVPVTHPAAALNAFSPLPRAIAPGAHTAQPPELGDAAAGTWQGVGLLQVSRALAVYDHAHDQLLSLGGSRAENWALPLAAPLAWHPLPASASPGDPYWCPSVQDPATGLVYSLVQGPKSAEIQTLDPQTGAVAAIQASGAPPNRTGGSLVFDAATQRLVLSGGWNQFFPISEVWVLDLLPVPTWSQWMASGTPPAWVAFPRVVVDPVRRHMLDFGSDGSGPTEIWALTLDGPPQWLRFATNGLPDDRLRVPNPMVYDPVSDRLWTIDGQGEPYSLSLETYQWSHVPALNRGPSPRLDAGIAIDPVRHQLLVSGGATPSGYETHTHSDTWTLSLDGPPIWAELVPDATRPPIRGGASDGYDASRGRLVVFGGSNGLERALDDTWLLDMGPDPQWSPLETQGSPPPPRYGHVSAWDEARDQLVVFGGFNRQMHQLNDLWVLSFAGAAPTWSPITPSGPTPAGGWLSQLVYDSARDRFLLLFGYGYPLLDEVWELRLSPTPAWRLLAPTGVPPAARTAAMCVYDPSHDRVLAFGGSTYDGLRNDLWALNLGSGDGAWQELQVLPGPSPRIQGLLRLDTGHSRLVLFGGSDVSDFWDERPDIERLSDTWALNLAGTPTWELLSPAGPRPSGRHQANGAYDPRYDRIVLACGGTPGSNDVWTLTFGDAPTLLPLASREVAADRVRLVWGGAEPEAGFTAYRRESGAEWVSMGALLADAEGLVTLEDRGVTPGTMVDYRLGATIGGVEMVLAATTVQVPQRALSLTARTVDGRASFKVELPTDDPATLSLFDITGRRVWSRPLGPFGPGSHEVGVDDAVLRSAVYFARLTQGPESRSARVLIVK